MLRCARFPLYTLRSNNLNKPILLSWLGKRAYIIPPAALIEQSSEAELEEHDKLSRIRQLTANARTLVRARRHDDASKVIDEGLELYPWQSSLWFWKIATKIGNSRGAIEVWDTMTRLGVEKYPEHYDIMANAVAHTSARHLVEELYEDLKSRQLVGNPKFYAQLFSVCRDTPTSTSLKISASQVWHELVSTPSLNHIVGDPLVVASYQDALAATSHVSPVVTRVKDSKGDSILSVHEAQRTAESVHLPVSSDHSSKTSSVPFELSTAEAQSNVHGSVKSPTHSSDSVDSRSIKVTESIPTLPAVQPATLRTDQHSSSPVGTETDTMRSMRNTLEPYFQSSSNVSNHKVSLRSARDFLQSTVSVDITTYNYVIRSAARVSEPAALLDILEEAIDRGLKPDAGTYNPIIRSFFQAERPNEALDLIDRMEISNVKFDFRTVNEVLRGLFRNKREDAAISFFVDIFQSASELSLMPGKDGEVNCFNLMIDGLANCGRLEDAQKLLSIMIQRDLEPTLMIYNALIRAAFAQNLVIDAMKYYTMATQTPELERKNIDWTTEVDELASTIVAGYLMTEHYEEAQHFLNDATAKGRWHNTIPKPFIHFITWFARHERLDEAWNLYHFHCSKFDDLGTSKLNIAVLKSIFLDRGDIIGGLRWARRLQEEGLVLEQSQYYDLVSAAMYNGERDLGEELWKEVMNFVANRGQRCITSLIKLGRQWGLERSDSANQS